ncbi:MAG: hypothetical protein IKH04_01330 [Kiritimatiellae bacterium]|nr:hypothetical protein [Kiritimatiellia bacterium]
MAAATLPVMCLIVMFPFAPFCCIACGGHARMLKNDLKFYHICSLRRKSPSLLPWIPNTAPERLLGDFAKACGKRQSDRIERPDHFSLGGEFRHAIVSDRPPYVLHAAAFEDSLDYETAMQPLADVGDVDIPDEPLVQAFYKLTWLLGFFHLTLIPPALRKRKTD